MVLKTNTPSRVSSDTPDRPRIRSRVLIIEGRFYEHIADELVRGAIAELEAQGASYERIAVPGALEIPQALQQAVAAGRFATGGSASSFLRAESGHYSGVVALGCVIRGETAHYDIVCTNANHWLMDIAIRHAIPVGNGILTVDTEAQAMARAQGGRSGKGGDAAAACLRLVEIARVLAGQSA